MRLSFPFIVYFPLLGTFWKNYVLYSITDIFVNSTGLVIIVFAGLKNKAKVILGIENDTEMSESDYTI